MKLSISIILLILCFLLTACSYIGTTANQNNATSSPAQTSLPETTATKDLPTYTQGSMPPPQPVVFETFESATYFIKKREYESFVYEREDWVTAYNEMNNRFMHDGYLSVAAHKDASRLDAAIITLYPASPDNCVCYWFELDNIHYQVMIFCTNLDEAYSINLETETFLDYANKRFTPAPGLLASIPVGHELFDALYIVPYNSSMFSYSVRTMIDSTHYINVRANNPDITAAGLAEFVEGLTFSKIALK